jgi:hypothetical protein
MKYVCLVYGEEQLVQSLSRAEAQCLDRDSLAYDEELQRGGHLVMAQALEPTVRTQTVRVREGKTTRMDGPFAETKEQLLGFVMVEARDDEEALQIAAGIPLAKMGTIEVRKVMEIPVPPAQ